MHVETGVAHAKKDLTTVERKTLLQHQKAERRVNLS